ncbi:MAG: PIG-L deacetylase family protein [Janthinobacterium lividum]
MLSGQTQHTDGFLTHSDQIPLFPSETVREWGPTLVVAPHPDDETLGCGGAIALLSALNLPVNVLFISDGKGSHPNSRQYPPSALRDLREQEAREALEMLGAAPSAPIFLRLPDGSVPGEHAVDFAEAVALCRSILEDFKPQTVLMPWRRDPHPDHRATSQIMRAALGGISDGPRILEYPIWAWERAAPEDVPHADEVRAFRLDIGKVTDVKRSAVAAHRSQVTHMIDDDPDGFWLSPEVLAHFDRSWEVYLEVLSW